MTGPRDATARADSAMLRFELAGYFRGGMPFRLVPLLPAAAFLGAWTWNVASPFAAAWWLACVALEPRINNMFYGTPREREALLLLPSRWRRIVLLKNLCTAAIAAFAFGLLSVILLWFAPGGPAEGWAAGAGTYLLSTLFPLLILGNEESSRRPRPDAGAFSGGIAGAAWISAMLFVVSVPYLLAAGVFERSWLCLPYAGAAAWWWYSVSVPRTAARIVNNLVEPWQRTAASSNS